jgi:alpha-L-fucosidase
MPNEPQATAGDTSWFTHDRFGLFIHWGLYALPARHEWVRNRELISNQEYRKYFEHFDPDLYEPSEWARLAKEAGMKYVVLTTKHHEGFCLWDSQLTDYKAPNTPAGRDLLRPFVDAFRAEGLRIGFYYSLIDWHHPEFPVDFLHPRRYDAEFREAEKDRDVAVYREYLHGQTRELLTQYGDIDIIWFDFSYSGRDRAEQPGLEWSAGTGKGKEDWGSEELLAMVRELQPGIIVNDRLEVGGDITTPEQYQPREWLRKEGEPTVWEACQTLNGSWGYDRDNQDWKPVDMLVRMLVDSVSKGGNVLLNVGPNARGEFEPQAVDRLEGIAEWMRLHSRSIYGCTASEFEAPVDCRFTQNGNRLYLHVFQWPFKHIHLDDMGDKIEYAQLLNDGSEVKMIFNDPHQTAQYTRMGGKAGTVTLQLPVQKPPVAVPVIEIFMRD